MTKHKKEAATQIWEYGVPDYSYPEILPACEIFPNHSGGFITTDMENITQNPLIINNIIEEITRVSTKKKKKVLYLGLTFYIFI